MLVWLFFVLFSLLMSYVGYRYVKDGLKYKKARNIHYIKTDEGVSLDNRKIYSLTPEELGF